MKNFFSVLSLGTLLFLGGCSFREEKGRAEPLKGQGKISFAQIYSRILKPECIGCHGGMHPPLLTNYAEVKASILAVEREVLEKKTMPKKGPLPDELQALLREWMENGSPEFGENPDPEPPKPLGGERPVVYWAELSQEVLKPKCFNCHFKDNPHKITDLEDYETFKATVGTSYFLAVVNPVMPPPPQGTPEGAPNPNRLTRSEMEMFSYWIVDGMQNKGN